MQVDPVLQRPGNLPQIRQSCRRVLGRVTGPCSVPTDAYWHGWHGPV